MRRQSASVVPQAVEHAGDVDGTREAHFAAQSLGQVAESDILDFFAERIDAFHNRGRLRRLLASLLVVACCILAKVQ